jgi:1-acyl-sn-glycerol-3-phosphate acyltransferase
LTILLYFIAFLRVVIIFSSMIFFIVGYLISCIFNTHTKERAFRLRRNWLKWIAIPVLNIKVIKTGDPIETPALYISNHRSFSDPIVLCRYIDAFVIAKAEVANYPIINKGAELTGVIWVKRDNQHSRKNSRSRMIKVIQSGYNVLVYPEGTVGLNQHTLDFRPGSFIECATNAIPVIPVAIEYRSEKDLWKREKFIPQYFYQFSKWKTEIKLMIGHPMQNENGTQLHADAQKWVNDQLAIMQQNWTDIYQEKKQG